MLYDCFIFFNELDLLEIRLNELDGVVDKFVLVEADRTFQNTKKPFIFEENKERFSKYLHKIIHIKLTKYPLFVPVINPFSPWKIEFFQRDSVVKGLVDCKPDDIIMISDVDEIPNSEVIKIQLEKGIQKIYGLKMDMFMYYLNNKLTYDGGSNISKEESKDGIWHCTALLPYKFLKKKPYRIRKIIMRTKRRGEVYEIIPNAGWHFTYIGGAKKIIEKLESFSHTEYNLEEFKNFDKISHLIKKGKDLFGREMEFEVVDLSYNLPKYLKTSEAQQKFKDLFIY
ncbi:glycosyltransferase family 17 protein [Flavobacterium lacus]|uniref:Beta-1,4-mannosyl-glycoprotein beta-1,4-N-acetylglucosaminyltransferase n=1 Tax=Flavobacterium lacus TaxID=1353778 RepID=A0A328WXQ2_9FLAO|nr:N-acetylglucosaminyltransferase [Flavobacterium lacus]RAR50982.1 beta-1,4-mannosyl-glycoprotein beta-1,4-N-acetylglucosaminyltransferase [Flavobacterium lacus]